MYTFTLRKGIIMTAAKMATLINRTGQLHDYAWSIAVTILDAKTAYGSIRLCVQPIGGHGQKWVSMERVVMDENP